MQILSSISRVILCSAVFVASATAEKSREDWLEELSAAYAKHESLIVTYALQGKGDSRKATIGMDNHSCLLLLHVFGEKGGKEYDDKTWNTPDDHFYIQGPDGLLRADGVTEEMRCLTEFLTAMQQSALGEPPTPFVPCPIVSVTLTKEAGESRAGIFWKRFCPWEKALREATVEASDEETVTFSSPDHGQLTFNRANGLLTRQSIKEEEGFVRTLIAEDVRLNPGREAITRLSSEWNTEAKVWSSYVVTRAGRAEMFQWIVDWVDQGHLTPEKLDTFLIEHHGLSEQLANACLNGPDSLLTDNCWKVVLDHTKGELRKTWLEKNSDPKTDEDKAFGIYLTDPKIRNASHEDLLTQILQVEHMHEQVMKQIFIDQPRPQGKTDDGKAAARVIQKALFRVFISVILDRKMTEFWGKVKR